MYFLSNLYIYFLLYFIILIQTNVRQRVKRNVKTKIYFELCFYKQRLGLIHSKQQRQNTSFNELNWNNIWHKLPNAAPSSAEIAGGVLLPFSPPIRVVQKTCIIVVLSEGGLTPQEPFLVAIGSHWCVGASHSVEGSLGFFAERLQEFRPKMGRSAGDWIMITYMYML